MDLGSLIIININEDASQLQVNSSSNIKVRLANIQSIRNKDLILYDCLQSNDTDICILTETWLQNCDSDEIWLEMTDLNKNDFKMEVSNRPIDYGVVCNLEITTKHDTMTVVVIYHPPYSAQHLITNPILLDEVTEWLPPVLTNHNTIIIAGDINLHVSDENNTDASIFIYTIESMGLQQHVTYQTHKSDSILDMVFTN